MQRREIVITGGAGFIGTNVAQSYLKEGRPVHILDNLSRAGVADNVREMQRLFGRDVRFTQCHVQDSFAMEDAISNAEAVYHLAAQVAVTTSLEDPRGDLATNLLGTMNVLEAIRKQGAACPLLFTSTNKVYGKLGGVRLVKQGVRWQPDNAEMRSSGVDEKQPLEFMSPYGCSKGSADQYVLDYAHSFKIPATVFRMSCIYGRFQLGSEDQGWVAHFLRQAMKQEPITIYGDGRQVRDLLFVDDLVSAMRLAFQNMGLATGEAFNIGGGPENSVSLVELIDKIGALLGREVDVEWDAERVADQKWYVAGNRKLEERLGWTPGTSVESGLRALYEWYLERPALVAPRVAAGDARPKVQVA